MYENGAFYYINQYFFKTVNLDGSITHCLKEVLKLEEFLQWRAPECMKMVHFTT